MIIHYVNCRVHKCSPISLIYQLIRCQILAAFSSSHAYHGIVLFCLGAWSSEATSRRLQDAVMYGRYEQWMARHGRAHNDTIEKGKRFKIFVENVALIESSNKDASKPYRLSVNQFADLADEDFKASKTGFQGLQYSTMTSSSFKYENVVTLPTTVDWRSKGAVAPIKDQGSCWAFSTVAATEGISQLRTGNLTSLSAEKQVPCDTENEAFDFIIGSNGISTDASYPYAGVNDTCKDNEKTSRATKITSYENVPVNSEHSLLKAVAHQPVIVCLNSGGSFQFYSSGVFAGPCGTSLDHCVTVVGYGVTENGTKYWLMKKSWGIDWGEEGYIRMLRDVDAKEGLCGLARRASYSTV